MKILVIGGTRFVGRHFVEAALARGHDLTLVHRGKSGPDLFPEVRSILSDRRELAGALPDEMWDAVADTCAYFPIDVQRACEALRGRVGYALQVSTISVYDDPQGQPLDEQSPLAQLDDPETLELTGETYGGLKAACERVAETGFPNLGIVRPTYILGPYDPTDRFAFWVDRLVRGVPVVLPIRPDGTSAPLQAIDARDLAQLIIQMVETQTRGIYNTANQSQPFGEILRQAQQELGSRSEIYEVQAEFEGTDFPLLEPHSGASDPFMTLDAQAARSIGLQIRPWSETIRDFADWWQAEPRTPKIGASDEKIEAFLASHTGSREAR
ncbi:MAG TPA: NAD-dependent epimerase/dehydratase family protein [Fimbriimonadaceae bacterium]|nr:NAD-dependent epimerase/dehydratase family protein [Fimbriimonadaceae bacterium]HRJ33522.1 NAD-dependent epimerase/dehydratase family protein [Fimbriimonadaceae bacterium]